MSQEERTILRAIIGLALVFLGIFGLFSSSYGIGYHMGGMMGWMMNRWSWDGWYGGFSYYLNLLPIAFSLIVTVLGIYIILNVVRGK